MSTGSQKLLYRWLGIQKAISDQDTGSAIGNGGAVSKDEK